MKLKINDAVYLQKYDIAFIMHDLNSMPESFLQETFTNNEDGFFFIMSGPDDGLYFKNFYKQPESIKWIMEQDWIVDFEKFVKKPLDELESLHEHLRLERDKSIDEFNAKDEEYRGAHFAEESMRFDRLRHKNSSLKALIDYLKGEVKFGFPDEYQEATTLISTRTTEKKPGLFARLWAFLHGTQ